MQQKFIITKDEKAANALLASGFKLIKRDGSIYTFLNDAPKSFSFANFDKSKIAYTNILSV